MQYQKKTLPLQSNPIRVSVAVAEIAQLVEHNLAKVGVASSSLVFRSKSKSFEDKIKQNPLKHRFRGFCIYCLSVSLRLCGAPTRHRPNLEVSLKMTCIRFANLGENENELKHLVGVKYKKQRQALCFLYL